MTLVQLDTILETFRSGKCSIGVIGLGYVGVPLSMAFGTAGLSVLGFDIDATKADMLNRGESYIKTIDAAGVAELRAAGVFEATSDFSRLSEPDALLICVPTPLTRHLEPDLSFVRKTTEAIAAELRPGQLVVLESTTYPGTTNEVLKPILEATGLVVGKDIYLAYSPEREDPGNPNFKTGGIPKVIGADDDASRDMALALYDHIVTTVPVSTMDAAEAVKITENIFRAVNIALVNELKLIYDALDINVWEVIEAAKTKPFGYMPFYPGPGLGGHCIPIDPFYLTWKAREVDHHTRFIELAGQINSSMPDYVIDRLATALDNRFGKGLNGSRILILGLAYKKNVDDTRESPALRIIERLEARKANVSYHDPFVPVIPATREYPSLQGRKSEDWDLEKFEEYDAILIVTDHDNLNYKELAGAARLVVDTRNACARASADLTNVVSA
ncbi:MAG: nucleotide sugar dehydrogenase [Pseudomonadota bacterium]